MARPSYPVDRRRLVRLLAGGSAALVPALAPGAADAGRSWCRTDPIVKIGGRTADVYVSAYVRNRREARELAKGPTAIVLTVPRGVPTRLVAHDHGFGFEPPYEIEFDDSDELDASGPVLPVRIAARVPMKDGSIRIKVTFTPRGQGRLRRGQGEGTANDWIRFDAAG